MCCRVDGSTPTRSHTRIADIVAAKPCSHGNPMPRSVAKDKDEAISAARSDRGAPGEPDRDAAGSNESAIKSP